MTSPSPDRSLRTRNVLIGVTVVAAVALLLALWNRQALFGPGGVLSSSKTVEHSTAADSTPPPPPVEPGDSLDPPPQAGTPEQRWTASVGSPPVWPADLSLPVSCEAVDRERHEVCAALDARTDADLMRRTGGACNLLRESAEALVARPPRIDSELRDYETLLANVFHLFRVLGRERLDLLRQTLARREDLAEPLALTTYRWLVSREQCAERGAPALPGAALYDYAGFVFSTLGGQAYLRRRSPRTEALACFYALEVLDRAAERKHNPQGLDPRGEILRCRELVASQSLVFRDEYVRMLEAMSDRWPAGGR